MNKKQRIVILAGLGIITLMLLVPPWLGTSTGLRINPIGRSTMATSIVSEGYALIFLPPYPSATIDIKRLAVQCLLVALVTGGIAFALHRRS